MAVDLPITAGISNLRRGDKDAARVLWEEYFEKLVRVALRRLDGVPRRAFNEEDVALSAMHSFCRGIAEGRFAEVKDRRDLWRLLVTLTARKACRQRRREQADKRGGGKVRGESAFAARRGDATGNRGIDDVLGSEPTPEFACMVAENCLRMMALLADKTLAEIARLRLEGYSSAEIAARLGCVERTVERKLRRIRAKWSDEELDA